MSYDHYTRPSSPVKIIGTLIAGCAALFFLCLLFLPLLFSTNSGKKVFLKILEKRSGFHLEIDKLSLSWFGIQNAEGIRAQKPTEQLLITCPRLSCDAPLWKIVISHEVGTLLLTDPSVQYAGPFSAALPLKKLKRKTAGLSLPDVQLAMPLLAVAFSGHFIVENGSIILNPPGLSPIHFDAITLSLEGVQKKMFMLDVSCATRQQEIEGKLSISGLAEDLKAPLPHVSMQASITQFPVRGIDQLIALFDPTCKGLTYAALGETLDIQCDMAAKGGNVALELDAKSPQLTAHIQTETTGGTLSLKNPAALSFTMTPPLFKKLATFFPPLANLNLNEPNSIQGTLSDFSCPLPLTKEALAKATFNIQMSAPSPWVFSLYTQPLTFRTMHLSANSGAIGKQILLGLETSLQMQTQTGTVNMKGGINNPLSESRNGSLSLKSSGLPVDLISIALKSGTPLSPFLGATVDLEGSIVMEGNDPKAHLSWQSAFLSVPSLHLSLQTPYKLLSPATFAFQLNPEQFKTVSANPIAGNIEQLQIPRDDLSHAKATLTLETKQLMTTTDHPLSGTDLKATLQVSGFEINTFQMQGQLSAGAISTHPMTLQQVELPFKWDAKDQSADLNLSAIMQNPSKDTGTLQAELSLSHLSSDMSRTIAQGKFDFQNFSPSFLEIFPGKARLGALLGTSCDAKITLYSAPDQQNLAIDWKSPYLTLDAKLFVDDTGIRLQRGTHPIQWVLTKEGYQSLDQMLTGQAPENAPFALAEASTFALLFNKLFLPLSFPPKSASLLDRIPNGVLDLAKLELETSISNPLLTFIDQRSKETIQLTKLSCALEKSGNSGPINISLESGVSTSLQATKNGSLAISGNMTAMPPQGFDFSHLTGGLFIKAQQLPSRALDIFARAQGRTDFPFTATFGNLINANISIQLQDSSGPVTVNVHTSMTQMDVKGRLTKGSLLLDAPLYAQIKITPEFSRLILKEVNPLNLSYVYSQDPITLEIPAEGFNLPLLPATPSTITIPRGKVELGKMFCRNEGNVNITLGLLKTKQFDKNGELSLWFAPIDLSVKKGVVEIERTEILLADTFDICLWGNIDLVKDYVDMVLGLTAQTLAKAFGIKGLPENYVLTIPMKGPADDVKINTGKATTKVALLLAWQNKNLAGALGGGPTGAIVGELLGRIATLPDSNANVPPAKHPFPWEIGKKSKTSQASETQHAPREKKRQFKTNDKPLKQILKVLR